jgi:biotin carboxyl carrier protein
MPWTRPLKRLLVLPLLLVLASAGCASAAPTHERWDFGGAVALDDAIPRETVQGALFRSRVQLGSHVELLAADGKATPVRVGADGGFVFGVGRDEVGPLHLRLTFADGKTRTIDILVKPREWQLENITGVPEATVNPPPEIAARIEREQAMVAAARTRDDDRDDYEAGFAWPVQGRVSGVYGSQRIYNGTPKSPHSGLDVAAVKGTPVHAPAAGIVTLAEPDLYLTGGTVLVDHGHGVSSNFLHFSRIDVKVGQRVEKGEVIGLVGATGRATGPHMHWGMNWFGVRVDPQLLLPPSPTAAAPATPSAGAIPSQ